MRILQINSTDLDGKNYNGYELHRALNYKGISSEQMVLKKTSDEWTVIPYCTGHEQYINWEMKKYEKRMGMCNLLEPFSDRIVNSFFFEKADIVHYHLIHNQVLPLVNSKRIMSLKPSVWTLHDLWAITGHCVHPLECDQWKCGCEKCPDLQDLYFPMEIDKAHDLWKIKKDLFNRLDIDIIVATNWMEKYLQESPITKELKHIHKIPFGIDIKKYHSYNRSVLCEEFGITPHNVVIGFRAEDFAVKGLKYINESLEKMKQFDNITILTVGEGRVSEAIKRKYQTIELGWQPEDILLKVLYLTDIFLMPSLAESFGLMAIEAMAARCAVVVFEKTVLEDLVCSPDCGIAVPYCDAVALQKTIERLIENSEERKARGELGRKIVEENYRFDTYVERHIEVYKEIAERNKEKVKEREKTLWDIQKGRIDNRMQIEDKMKQIHNLKQKLNDLSNGKAQKIVIFCAGAYGRITYKELYERLIKVDYVVDNNKEKWGDLRLDHTWMPPYNDVKCVGLDSLLQDRGNVLIIVSNKHPESLVDDLKTRGFQYIITKQELDIMMKDIPRIGELNMMEPLEKLDFSSEEVKYLTRIFNKTIADICEYYETRIWRR